MATEPTDATGDRDHTRFPVHPDKAAWLARFLGQPERGQHASDTDSSESGSVDSQPDGNGGVDVDTA